MASRVTAPLTAPTLTTATQIAVSPFHRSTAGGGARRREVFHLHTKVLHRLGEVERGEPHQGTAVRVTVLDAG